jgi:SAM-dependent methyltransferase
MSVFGYLNHHPWRARRFANAMSFFNGDPDHSPYHLFDAFDWKTTNTFVDVGGSLGDTAINLAKREPHMTCITQDQAGLSREAQANIPAELQNRVTFMEHSFFNDQPLKDADVYHFRWIFHNWSDKYCRRILQALIPALKPGARVIVQDFVIPPLGASSAYQEWAVR